jgi:hypothetical protein
MVKSVSVFTSYLLTIHNTYLCTDHLQTSTFLLAAYCPCLPSHMPGAWKLFCELIPSSPWALLGHVWFDDTRFISKVRKTQHQNPEFGHKRVEIKEKPKKKDKYNTIQGGRGVVENLKTINFCAKLVSSHLSFCLSAAPPLLLHVFSLLLPVQLL